MLVQIRDRAALSSLSIVGLRSYLTSHGWSDEGALGKRPATIYAKEHGGRSWEVLVPLRDTIADYAESMAASVAVLADVENRSQLDVFRDLSSVGADIVHIRSANELLKESISLRQSAGMYNDAYNMLVSAARAVEKPQAAYRGNISSDVAEYLDSVQSLPSYHEGYALTLHSPVPAGIGIQEDLGDGFYTPFSRRATSTLVRALGCTSTAVEEAVARDTLEPFDEAVSHGVSANLCDSVAQMAKKGRGIKIDVVWAVFRPSNHPDPHFAFSQNSADILVEAAKSFRRNKPSYGEQIVAQVVELEREPREFDGRAVLLSTRDERFIRIRVKFDQSVYDTVIQAFQKQWSISLEGDVHPSGMGYELHNPRNLSILPEG